MKKFYMIIIPMLLVLATTSLFAYKSSLRTESSYIDRFHAHRIVKKLSKDNLIKLQFIEIISKNFGYKEFYTLKKNYWKARLLVIKSDIITAKIILEKNQKDISLLLNKISKQYKRRTHTIYSESITKLNEYALQNHDSMKKDIKQKIVKNKLRLNVINTNLDNALKAIRDKDYQAAINLYRRAKDIGIVMLKDLSEPSEKKQIISKYQIDLADNRHEVFKGNM